MNKEKGSSGLTCFKTVDGSVKLLTVPGAFTLHSLPGSKAYFVQSGLKYSDFLRLL